MLPTVMSGLGTGTTTNVHTSPLTRQSKQHNSLVKTVTDKLLLKDLDHLTECVHTTTLEVYHSMYLKYLPKRTHFGYDVMVHASMLAALDHNNNVNKEQTQLTMMCLGLQSCKLVIWTPSEDIELEIPFDKHNTDAQVQQLQNFFFVHMVPRLADDFADKKIHLCPTYLQMFNA
ncbi:hypothetical protein PO909_000857 [Leuciscus waleckii]